MVLKSESSFKEYLKKLPDHTIIEYYSDVEYSPFPIILIQEYARRFQQKNKNEIIKDLKYHTQLARKKTQEINKMAKKRISVDDLTKQKTQKIIEQAKRKGYSIGKKISIKHHNLSSTLKKTAKSKIQKTVDAGKKLQLSKKENLEILEKLAKLKDAGIITTKEFQEKKKKILSNI
jgi:chorismate synthase